MMHSASRPELEGWLKYVIVHVMLFAEREGKERGKGRRKWIEY